MKTILSLLLIYYAGSAGFSQINWTKYDENPVLKRNTVIADLANDFFAISDNWVLKDGDRYKMWYTCGGFNYPTDEFEMRARICYCESEDGIIWEKYAENPVLDIDYSGGWDSLAVETATVIIDLDAPTEARYKMWYAGQTETGGKYNLGYAYSAEGINWTKHPEAVLTVGSDTEWDNGFLEGPSVIKDEGQYKMWYAAFDASFEGAETDGFVNIGYATSTDGINWDKYTGNPVLTVSESDWDSIYVQDPHIIKNAGTYHLWYGGASQYDFYGQETGYASSPDGINWTKSALNPILKHGTADEWDENTASFPSVLLEDDGRFKMWYTGKDVEPLPEGSSDYYWEIGYATGDTLNLSIDEDKLETQIFPNPFTDKLILRTTETIEIVLLYNVLGEVIMTHYNSANFLQIDVSKLPNGIYFIQVNGKTTKKIVKSE